MLIDNIEEVARHPCTSKKTSPGTHTAKRLQQG